MTLYNLKIAAGDAGLKGDRTLLPVSILEELQNSIEPPYFFMLTLGSIKTTASVIEFTAEEGQITLSRDILSFFEAKGVYFDGQLLTCQLIDLEKGTHVDLTPMSAHYLQIPNIRAALEAHLRKYYSTLTLGMIIRLPLDSKNECPFLVKSLKPRDSVSCLNTDLEVDITPDNVDIATAALKGTITTSSWSLSNVCELRGKVNTSQTMQFSISLLKNVDEYDIKLQRIAGDVNLFVCLESAASILHHDAYLVNLEQDSLTIKVSDIQSNADKIQLTVQGHSQQEASFCINLSPAVISSFEDSNSASSETTGKSCPNCGANIPEQSFTMHIVFCERHNTKCPVCQKIFQKSAFSSHWHCDQCNQSGMTPESLAKHKSLEHKLLECICSQTLYLPQVAFHCRRECPERMIICRFCHLLVRAGEFSKTGKDLFLGSLLTEHESECGARTVTCQTCKKHVQLKDVQLHMDVHRKLSASLQKESGFQVCMNLNCSMAQTEPKNDMKLCKTCFSPFWSPRVDGNQSWLRNKLLLVYMNQLMKGCGHKHCYNKYCVSSKDSFINQPKQYEEAEAISQELLNRSFFGSPDEPEYYLCVYQASNSERRHLANQLIPLGYSINWCIKALMEEKDSLDNAALWLSQHAPHL